MNKIHVLDTTLRDGSYAVNFSFTAGDTSLIVGELADAGVEFIEIGHGIGLGANKGENKAAETDCAYIEAANQTKGNAKCGVFCIPGIASIAQLEEAIDSGIDFVRIGTDVTEVETSKAFIETAKKAGIMVMANFMKSYAVSPTVFAESVLMSEDYGVDAVYIVDSAGGMIHHQLEEYFEQIRKYTSIPLGFHGHDNLALAIANSLKAMELGMTYIDTSLQGLGRSAGNAATEILTALCEKRHYDIGIDLLKVLEVSEKFIRPFIEQKGKDRLDIISGYADFHSSYMKYIHYYAAKYLVDPLRLIIEISKVNKIEIDFKAIERIAADLPRDRRYLENYNFNRYVGGEQDEQLRQSMSL